MKSEIKSRIKKAIVILFIVLYLVFIIDGFIVDVHKIFPGVFVYIGAFIMSGIACSIDVGLSSLIIDARKDKNPKKWIIMIFLCVCRVVGVLSYTLIINMWTDDDTSNIVFVTLAIFTPTILINLWRDVFTFQCLEDKINELGEKYCKKNSSPTKEN